MKKIYFLIPLLPILMSASGPYHSQVFNYNFNNVECVQSGNQTKKLISNDGSSVICDVNFTYEMYKLPMYAPYEIKHQTYHFAYSVEIYMYGTGYYKNGLFNWATADFNSHLPEKGLITTDVFFSNNVNDAVFYSMANDSRTNSSSICRAVENFRGNVDYSYEGNKNSGYSSVYRYFYKYLENGDALSNSIKISGGLQEYDFNEYYVKISAKSGGPLYDGTISTKTSSDYGLMYYFGETDGFPEGRSYVGVDRDKKQDVSLKTYDQFCIDTYNISGASTVSIRPRFTIIEGTGNICDYFEFPFAEYFTVNMNFR